MSRTRSASSARTERYRARQRHGLAILRTPVPLYTLAAALIESGRLTPAGALDRRQVEQEAAQVLVEWCRRWLERKSDA